MPLFYSSYYTVKKLFAIAFSCVYLTLTVGVAKTTHYCMGRENNSSLFSFDSKKCGCSLFESKDAKSCCSDTHDLIQIGEEQTLIHSVSLNGPELFDLGKVHTVVSSELFLAKDNEILFYYTDNSPPPIPLYRLFGALIYYEDDSIIT